MGQRQDDVYIQLEYNVIRMVRRVLTCLKSDLLCIASSLGLLGC